MLDSRLYKVSNAELSEDLMQNTFLAMAEKIGGFEGESSPKTWVFSILNHKINRQNQNRTIRLLHFFRL